MKPRGASGQQEVLSPLLASCSSPIHREISLNQIRRSRIDGRGGGYALAARTGQVVWSVRTPGTAKYEASPLAADGKIYLFNFDGQVTGIDEYGTEKKRGFTVRLEDTNNLGECYVASMTAAKLIDLRSVQVAFLEQEGIFFMLHDVDVNAAWHATLEKFL